MSDSEFDGLKGKVKGVIEEAEWTYTPPSGTPETKRQKTQEWKYDPSGRITEYINWSAGDKIIYSIIDGSKVYNIEEFDVPGVYRAAIGSAPFGRGDLSPKPRDPRFSMRFEYKYDSMNRVSEEIEYLNNGELLSRAIHSYDEHGRDVMSKSYYKEILRGVRTSYYNSKGELFLQTLENPADDRGLTRREIHKFSDYKFDKNRNWTQRTESTYSMVDKGLKEIVTKRFRTITYY